MNHIWYHKVIDCSHIHVELSKVSFKSLLGSLRAIKPEQYIVLCDIHIGATRIDMRLRIIYL